MCYICQMIQSFEFIVKRRCRHWTDKRQKKERTNKKKSLFIVKRSWRRLEATTSDVNKQLQSLVKSEGVNDPTWSRSRGTVSLALHQVVWLNDWFYSSTSLFLSLFFFSFWNWISSALNYSAVQWASNSAIPQRVNRNWESSGSNRSVSLQKCMVSNGRTNLA